MVTRKNSTPAAPNVTPDQQAVCHMTSVLDPLILHSNAGSGTVMDRVDLLRQLELLHPDSFGWAMACCNRERGEAEEVLQSAYVAILDGRARYDGRATFRTWLFGVIRLTAKAQRRRRILRWLRWERPLDGREPADSRTDPAAGVERSDSAEQLARALGVLPPRQRQLLHLVFYHELSIREASEVLGISIGSARTHYERGKKRLRILLDREDQR